MGSLKDELSVSDKKHVEQALELPQRAELLQIQTPEDYLKANEMRKGIKQLKEKVTEVLQPHVKRAHEAWKALVAERDKAIEPLDRAESIIRNKMNIWDQAKERERQEEQRRREQLARQQEEERRLAEAAALEREAKELGDTELLAEVDALLSEPIQIQIAPVEKQTPEIKGVSRVTTYSGQCIDIVKLAQFIGNHPEHANLIKENQAAINSLARSMREALDRIPGLKHVKKTDLRGTGRD